MRARQSEWSAIASADDLYTRPTVELVSVLLAAGAAAQEITLTDLAERCTSEEEAGWVNLWPGEHYRLLPALAATVDARTVVEIGTFRGHSALALLAGIAADGRVVTYDIVPWDKTPGAVIRGDDLGSRLEQRIGDLSDRDYLEQELDTLLDADLIFIDGPKDGEFERRLCDELLGRLMGRPRLVVFDDIRRLNMIQLWRDLPFAKLDATSLGHWSGTGLLLTTWE